MIEVKVDEIKCKIGFACLTVGHDREILNYLYNSDASMLLYFVGRKTPINFRINRSIYSGETFI
jgi:hypothetical protein